MESFISFFNNVLNRQSNKTYGDLLNNDIKGKIKNSLSEDELEQYNELEKKDKEKLLENCGNNNQVNNKVILKPQSVKISGIGEVQQIM